jgi:branched-chain amino acid transport system permease protein
MLDIVIFGVINSLTLVLMAIGFGLAYSVSRVPNFAHGALYILTAYVCWVFLNRLGLNYLLSIILSIVITAIVGWLIYKQVLIRVRGMQTSEILASSAIGVVILELLRWQGLRGGIFMLPPITRGTVDMLGTPVDYHRLFMVGMALLVTGLIWVLTRYTKVGLGLRAIAQDERAALMLGIDSDLAASIALALGSALAGVAAIVILPLGSITVTGGYDVLIFAIAVCICGGLGSWRGMIAAAFTLGFAQTIAMDLIATHFAMVVVMAAIILTLIFKPSGLLGTQKALEERV